jgi:hypothetical protein
MMTDTTLRSCCWSAMSFKESAVTYSLVANDQDVLALVVDLVIS